MENPVCLDNYSQMRDDINIGGLKEMKENGTFNDDMDQIQQGHQCLSELELKLKGYFSGNSKVHGDNTINTQKLDLLSVPDLHPENEPEHSARFGDPTSSDNQSSLNPQSSSFTNREFTLAERSPVLIPDNQLNTSSIKESYSFRDQIDLNRQNSDTFKPTQNQLNSELQTNNLNSHLPEISTLNPGINQRIQQIEDKISKYRLDNQSNVESNHLENQDINSSIPHIDISKQNIDRYYVKNQMLNDANERENEAKNTFTNSILKEKVESQDVKLNSLKGENLDNLREMRKALIYKNDPSFGNFEYNKPHYSIVDDLEGEKLNQESKANKQTEISNLKLQFYDEKKILITKIDSQSREIQQLKIQLEEERNRRQELEQIVQRKQLNIQSISNNSPNIKSLLTDFRGDSQVSHNYNLDLSTSNSPHILNPNCQIDPNNILEGFMNKKKEWDDLKLVNMNQSQSRNKRSRNQQEQFDNVSLVSNLHPASTRSRNSDVEMINNKGARHRRRDRRRKKKRISETNYFIQPTQRSKSKNNSKYLNRSSNSIIRRNNVRRSQTRSRMPYRNGLLVNSRNGMRRSKSSKSFKLGMSLNNNKSRADISNDFRQFIKGVTNLLSVQGPSIPCMKKKTEEKRIKAIYLIQDSLKSIKENSQNHQSSKNRRKQKKIKNRNKRKLDSEKFFNKYQAFN